MRRPANQFVYNPFNHDGFLGDKFLVSGVIQSPLHFDVEIDDAKVDPWPIPDSLRTDLSVTLEQNALLTLH